VGLHVVGGKEVGWLFVGTTRKVCILAVNSEVVGHVIGRACARGAIVGFIGRCKRLLMGLRVPYRTRVAPS
jgi:hypothetical protein